MDLNELAQRLQHFAKRAQQIDLHRGAQSAPLFSRENFHCRAKTLAPYVHETQTLVKHLATHSTCDQTPVNTEHLCERLFNQINLLQRVLVAPAMLNAPPSPKQRHSAHDLREKITQHQKWELELSAMINSAHQQLNTCAADAKQSWLQHIATTTARLKRCQSARQELEAQMAIFSKKQRDKNGK
ncbi:MAG: primosomal replication protein PriC [Vibrionaceae bacterium]